MTVSELARCEAHFSGHVQGVGFRYSTHRLASDFAVSGFVKNLADGRVQVVVEGSKSEMRRFVQALESEMAQYIDHVEVTTRRATGEFTGFEIRR